MPMQQSNLQIAAFQCPTVWENSNLLVRGHFTW